MPWMAAAILKSLLNSEETLKFKIISSFEEGLVKCNDEVEYRKRKKLKGGDVVVFKNYTIKII